MARLIECDQCHVQVNVYDLMEDAADPWPAIITATPDEPDPCFCTWKCLSEYAQSRVLIESAGEGP